MRDTLHRKHIELSLLLFAEHAANLVAVRRNNIERFGSQVRKLDPALLNDCVAIALIHAERATVLARDDRRYVPSNSSSSQFP